MRLAQNGGAILGSGDRDVQLILLHWDLRGRGVQEVLGLQQLFHEHFMDCQALFDRWRRFREGLLRELSEGGKEK